MPKKKAQPIDHSQYETKVAELEHSLKRALADFENYRKRIEQERQTIGVMAKVKILHDLLPILDNFSRAAAHLSDDMKDTGWAMGILAIHKQFEEFLKQQGLESINPEPGTPFGPRLHEAISHEPHESIPADHIVQTVEIGYSVNDQILRPAKVRVSSGE